MARPLRLHVPGTLYHVISRGNDRQAIFVDRADFRDFLDRLASTSARFAVLCRAYCLMPNHVHLLLEPSALPLSRMMQQLNSGYCQAFNRRHGRVGHVLQGRFKSHLVESGGYARRVLRYIALNPVRAGLVARAADYPWSGYRATAGLVAAPRYLALNDVWRLFDPANVPRAQALFAAFVDSRGADAFDDSLVRGSAQFAAALADPLAAYRTDRDLIHAERFASRPGLDALLPSLRDLRSRDTAMRDAFELHGYTLRQIGDVVGRAPATVWKRIRRVASASAPVEHYAGAHPDSAP